MELKVIGHIIVPYEPGFTYFASSSIVNDLSCNGKLACAVNMIDLFFPVLKLTHVDWKPTSKPSR